MTGPEPDTVLAWHEALNAGDAERVASLSEDALRNAGLDGSDEIRPEPA